VTDDAVVLHEGLSHGGQRVAGEQSLLAADDGRGRPVQDDGEGVSGIAG
jgi:hypothetical protein